VEIARTLIVRDGAVIGYRLWRPGVPRRVLVLVHGVASNLSRWSELVGTTSLRDSWDLLRLDLRGYATSIHRGRLDLDVWCADLARILTREACPPAVVAGHSLGASIAVEFARRHPDLAAGLVLVDPIVRRALVGPLRHVAALRAPLVPVVMALRGLNALGLHRRRLPPLDLEQLDQEMRRAMAADGDATLTRRYASPFEDLKTTPTVAYLQSLMAVSRGLPDLARVRVPVLALIAEGGLMADSEVTERALAAFPNCRIRRIAAKHWIPTERPEELRRALEAWCRDLDGAVRR